MERFLKSKFKIGTKLNENLFSLTYNGTTLSQDKPIIIKIYKRGTLNSPIIRAMKQKVKILQEQIHPRIVPLLDGDYGWQGFYYIRPFIEGKTLKEAIKEKSLNFEDSENIILQICDAIASAHKHKIIHGALSESNIFLTKDGIKIVDFIIEGEIKESLPQKAISILENGETLSPEEIFGRQASFSSDIFSAGVLFYKMLASKPPFKNHLDKLHGKFDPISNIPRYLQDIIQKALETDPLLRFKKISDLAESLKNKTVINYKEEFDLPPIEFDNLPPPKEKEIHIIKKEREKNFFLATIVVMAALAGIIYAIITSIFSR